MIEIPVSVTNDIKIFSRLTHYRFTQAPFTDEITIAKTTSNGWISISDMIGKILVRKKSSDNKT